MKELLFGTKVSSYRILSEMIRKLSNLDKSKTKMKFYVASDFLTVFRNIQS